MSRADDPCTYLPQIKAIAADAGARILEVYQRPFTVAAKEDGSPLTEADRAAHRLIVTQLSALTPDVPLLSEESGAIDFRVRGKWTRFWLVDPLDGTKEFVKRNDEFSVNIALVDHGRPVLGVVLAPVLDVLYWACAGEKAFKRSSDGSVRQINARRYAGGKATVAVSRSHPGERLAGFLHSMTQREGEPETLAMGSAVKICLVAEGAADAYPRFGPTSEWDTAAAQCVLEAAGGRLTDFRMRPLTYNKRSLLNPWFLASGVGDYDWTVHLHD